jgi:membrane-associated phospholipid phosphatase
VLGRGFTSTSFQSFPSGHSTAAFSAAAAVTSETSDWWPHSTWVIGPVLYGGASLVGVSRMYEDKHWASDVVMGAAVGVFAGLKTVRFNHTHTGNRIDRWLLGGEAGEGNGHASDAHLRLRLGDVHELGVEANLAW